MVLEKISNFCLRYMFLERKATRRPLCKMFLKLKV